MKAIVTTTINYPTEAILKFSINPEWQLYIVGDKKTPHEAFKDGRWIYLSPDDQEARFPKISKMLGWNNIQRRNIGFLAAVHDGAEIIATVDDDNIPMSNWGENLLVGNRVQIDSYLNQWGLFDPLALTSISKYWHRGYPPSLVNHRFKNARTSDAYDIDVEVSLWNGKPDVDAFSRLMYGYNDEEITGPFPYASPRTIFSSQNAFLSRAVMPYYAVLPFVGRMDDIWGCINLQKQIECHIAFSAPSTFHNRNVHDSIHDLKEEITGYRDTMAFLEGKDVLPVECKQFLDAYYEEMISVIRS
tara:strand:+ start:2750 stop:3655 length:906 start_codon:yes stop_codon:yes gene_type:complete